jgi:hypothetical protein
MHANRLATNRNDCGKIAAMTDNFMRELEEEVRRDKVADLWKRHGNLIVAAAVLLVVAVGGWRFWEYRKEQTAIADSGRLEAALKASRENRGEDAARGLADIAATGSDGYRLVARFRAAAEAAKSDGVEGVRLFDALAADAALPQNLRDLARLRSGLLRVDTAPFADVRSALEPLAGQGGIWRHSAREAIGVAALKAGNFEEAGRWFDQLIVDREAPQNLRQRGELYLGIVRAGPVPVQ